MLSMTEPQASVLPARRPELVIRSLGKKGKYIMKDPRAGAYFQIGEQEFFLLNQLDGSRSAGYGRRKSQDLELFFLVLRYSRTCAPNTFKPLTKCT